jgi:hypothetical protein
LGKNHFFVKNGCKRPVVLLLNGHTSHIDLQISKFCKENGIMLYCLPPHSSHITQPLDVGFFSPLNANWKSAVAAFKVSHFGQSLTKEKFAKVFKEAWLDTVKARLIINGFADSGIFPVNAAKVGSKASPSDIFCGPSSMSPQDTSSHPSSAVLQDLEEQMEETILHFKERFAEGDDLVHDPLYNVWSKLKRAVLKSDTTEPTSTEKDNSNPIPEFNKLSIAPAFQEELKLPKPVQRKKTRVTVKVPSYLSGQEMIDMLENKKKEKEEMEAIKVLRKAEREEKRLQREREKEKASRRREQEREREKRAGRGRGRGRGGGTGRGKETSNQHLSPVQEKSGSCSNSGDESGDGLNSPRCPVCNAAEEDDDSDDDVLWVQCDNEHCSTWYHVQCTNIDHQDCKHLDSISWLIMSLLIEYNHCSL